MGSTIGSAYHTVPSILDKQPTVDAIFSVNGTIIQDTLQALKSKGLQGRIKFIGFDLNPVIMDAIINHELDTTIVQAPFQIGHMGVKAAFQIILHEKVPKKIFTDTILLTTENYQTDKGKGTPAVVPKAAAMPAFGTLLNRWKSQTALPGQA